MTDIFDGNVEEVRKYCCCASNLVCSKILGVIGIIFSIYNLASWIIAVNNIQDTDDGFQPIMALPLVDYLLSLLANICLVVGSTKRNKNLLLLWIVLAVIALLGKIGLVFLATTSAEIISCLIVVGLTTWTILVVYGAIQEIKSFEIIH